MITDFRLQDDEAPVGDEEVPAEETPKEEDTSDDI